MGGVESLGKEAGFMTLRIKEGHGAREAWVGSPAASHSVWGRHASE